MMTEVVSSTSRTAAPGPARTLRAGFALAAFALMSALVFAAPAGPAAAAGSPQISVSPSSGLDPNGAIVVVSGSGFKPNVQLFLMECRNNSGEDHTCNSIGLQKISTDGSGNFSGARVKVIGYFGSTDCSQIPCAVKTSAVSGHSGDRSQDVLAAISFGAPPTTTPPPTAPPATQPPATQPPATAAPATEVPAATTTTEAPATTTTTESPGDEATTTTTEATVDGSAAATTTTSPSKVTELAAGTDTSNRAGGDDDSSSLPAIVGLVVVVLAAVGGGIYLLRSRAAH